MSIDSIVIIDEEVFDCLVNDSLVDRNFTLVQDFAKSCV